MNEQSSDRPPPTPLDASDRRILTVLREDGRISMNELASRVNLSRATTYTRVQRLLREGVITGFRAEVEPEVLGYGLTAVILLNLDQSQWSEARKELRTVPGVEHIALTSGEFDVFLFVRAPDVHALRDVVLVRLQAMRHVKKTETIIVLDEEQRLLPVEFVPPARSRSSSRSGVN